MPYFQMPDGRYFEYPEGVSYEDAITQASQRFPKAYGMEKSGVSGALSKGLESLTSSLTTATEAGLGDANAAAKRALKRQKAAGEVYADETGLDKLQKRWDEEGLGGAFKEVMRQTPLVIAEQFPNLGASLASARIGAMAGAATPIPGGALIGGALGAFLPSAAQQFGANIERQAYEQEQRGEPININTRDAAKNAAFQGALDVGGTGAALGKKLVNRVLGQDVFKLVKEGATDEAQRLALSKIANESFLPSLKGKKFGAAVKGAGKGILFEDLTEVGQQMLERAQAGLDLFSPDAYAEYADTAFQTTLMAGPLGTMGAYADRSGAKKQLQQLDRIKAANEQAAEDERRATPEYGIGLAEQRLDLHDQLNALNDEVKAAGKGLSKEQKAEFDARRADIEQRINDLDQEIDSRDDKDQIYQHAQYMQQQRAGQAPQMGLPGIYQAPAAEAEQAAPEITPLAEAQMRAPAVRTMLEQLVARMNKAVAEGDTATANELMPKYRELVDYYNRLEGVIKNAPQADDLEKKLKEQVRAYRKAVDPNVGDVAAAEKALAKIQELQQQLSAVKAEQDMFTAEGAVSPEVLRQNEAVAQRQALGEQYDQRQQDLFAQTEAEALGQPYTEQPDQAQLLSNLLAQQGQPELTPEGLPKPQAATFMDASTRAGQPIPVYTIDPVTGKQVLRSTVRQEAPAGAYQQAKQAEEMGPQPSAEKPLPRTQAEIRAANREAARISGEELESEDRTEALMQKLAEQQPEGKGDFANLLPTMRGTGAKFDPTEFFTPEAAKILKPKFDELAKLSSERDLLPKDYVDFATKSDKYVESALNGFNKVLNELGETDWSKVPGQERAARYQDAYAKSRGIIEALLRSVEASRLANGNAGLTNRQAFEMSTKLREMFDYALENRSARPDFRKNIAKLKVEYKKPATKVLKGAERPEKQAPRFRLEAQEAEEKAPREDRIVEMERLDRMTRDLKNELYDAQKAGDKAAVAAVGKQLAAVSQQRKALGAPEKDITAAKRKVAGLQKLLSAAEFAAAEKGKVTTPAVEKAKVKLEEAQAELDKVTAAPEPEAAPEEKLPHPKQKGHQFKLFKDDAKYLGRQLAALKKREQERDREIGELLRVAEAKRQKDINDAIKELEAAYNEDKATYDEALAHALEVMTDIMRRKYLVKPEQAASETKDILYKALQERTKLRKKILGSRKIQPHLMSFLQAFGGRTRTSQRKGPKFSLSSEKNKELKQRLGLIQDVQDNADAAFKRYVALPDPTETNMTPQQIQERMDAQVAYYSALGMVKQMEQDLHNAGLSNESTFSDVLGITPQQVLEFSLTPEEKAVLKEADALVNEAEQAMLDAEDTLEKAHQRLNMAERKSAVVNRRHFQKMRTNLAKIQKQIDTATEALTLPSPDKERLRKENETRRTETAKLMATAQEVAEQRLKDKRETEQRELEARGLLGGTGQRVVHVFVRDPITGKPVYKTSGSYVTEVYDPKTRTWAKLKDKAPLLQKQTYAVEPKETREQTATLKAMDKLYGAAEESRAEQTKVDKKLGRVTPQQLAENYMAMQKTYENFADAMPDDFRKDLEEALDKYKGILKTYNVDAMAFIDAKSTESKRLTPLRTGKVREATEVDMTRVALERLLSDNAGRVSGSKAVKGVTAMLEAFRDSKSFDQIKARFKTMQGERTHVPDSHFTKYAFERPVADTTKESYDFSEVGTADAGKATGNKADEIVSKLKSIFKGAKDFDQKVTVFQTLADAQKVPYVAEALASAKDPSTVQAFVTPDGQVYMIAERIKPGTELAVMLHEVGVHVGMERLIGKENMSDLGSQIESWAKAKDGSLESEIAQRAVKRASKSSSANKQEETIAYFVEEAVKSGVDPIYESETKSSLGKWFAKLVKAFKSALAKIGLGDFNKLTAQDIVDMAYGAANMEFNGVGYTTVRDLAAQYNKGDTEPAQSTRFSESSILDMMKPSSGKFNSEFDAKYPGMSSFGDRLIAKDKGVVERVAANSTGLRFAIQFVDRFAGLQHIARTMKDKLGGFQMMYWLRAFDQRNNLTAQAASVGVPYMREEVRADGKKEWTLDTSKDSSNLHDIVQTVGKAIPDVGDANATMRMFSLYRMAKRVMRLNREGKDGLAIALGRNISSAERAEAMKQFKAALDFGNSNAHFKAADEMYTRYNRALINFLAQSGAISKEQAATLNKGGDYIGFYREKDGFIVDGEHNITMGDLTTQPYLRELLGGDTAIVDFRTSSLQNTSLIISMALNNFATRNTAVTLTQLGLAKPRSSKGPAADNVVRYKVHGEDWHIVVDQDKVQSQFDIPADLLVKGMRGVSTTLPAVVRMMQGPANLLRKGVTRMPTYMVRQLVRDSLNASIAGGLDGNPLTQAIKQFRDLAGEGSEAGKRIQSQGFGGGQLFSGTPNDIKRLMTDIMAGTNSWDTAMAWLDKMSHNADTATRAAAYDSFIKQGMSDMEASLASLEMTNFSKRGVSPSMAHMATMIPFFNAQIQGLNALWQAYKGTGIASERLNLKNKLIKRGTFMMAMSVMYALAMKDDEAYIKEDMDTKLSNWIFYPPGFDFSIKMPIPFEVGMVFKAIPEALINMANNDKVDRDVLDALGKMALGSVPGGSSFFIPQAAKPAIEVLTGKNLFDFSITEGRLGDIESARLKGLEPGERTNAGTSSIASALGGFLNVSPVKIDHLIRGYGGSMGAFLASAVGTIPDVLGKAKPPAPESKMSQIPLIGGLFGDKDGRALIERAYNNMEDIQQAHGTWKKLMDEGRTKEADEYAKRKANMINANSLAGQFRQKMGDLAAAKRAIAADPSMNPKEKRSAIKEIEAQENELAKQLNSI